MVTLMTNRIRGSTVGGTDTAVPVGTVVHERTDAVIDFTQAALLIGAVFAVTELFKRVVPQAPNWVVQLVPLAIGIAVTFLVAYSTYGNTQKVGDVVLSDVNVAGLILIGILIGGGATVLHQGLGAIANVGENKDGVGPS